MKKTITWLGHNCWLLELGETKLLVDPFLQTRTAPVKPDEVHADYVLVSHGHGDHCADALAIAKRCDSTLVGIAEVCQWFAAKGIKKTEGMNIGGTIPFECRNLSGAKQGIIMMLPALHSSTMPDGTSGGNSCGFLIAVPKSESRIPLDRDDAIKPVSELLKDAWAIYFACDTGYFHEMNWIGKMGIDVAVIPIGNRYTMGPAMSLDAISSIHPDIVIPSHYGTWPPIDQNVDRWAEGVKEHTTARPVVAKPGQRIDLN